MSLPHDVPEVAHASRFVLCRVPLQLHHPMRDRAVYIRAPGTLFASGKDTTITAEERYGPRDQ